MKVRFTATALRETEEIFSYISAYNPRAAIEMRERIESAAQRLSDEPFAGPRTDEPTVRRLTVRHSPYLIYYTLEQAEVIILHVRHGARRRLWETGP